MTSHLYRKMGYSAREQLLEQCRYCGHIFDHGGTVYPNGNCPREDPVNVYQQGAAPASAEDIWNAVVGIAGRRR